VIVVLRAGLVKLKFPADRLNATGRAIKLAPAENDETTVARGDFTFYGSFIGRLTRPEDLVRFCNSRIALLGESNMIFKARCGLTREPGSSHATNCESQATQFLDEEGDKEGTMQPSRSKFSGPIPISFEMTTHAVSMSPEVCSLCCPECEIPLDLHQPDDNEPTQLLGICGSCCKWYFLVEIESDWNDALLFELPSAGAVRALLIDTAASA
jgi:hypothetical protein